MSTMSRICLLLAAFLAIAGGIYWITSHEPSGTTLLLAGAATFCFVGLVSMMVARRASGSETGEGSEGQVAPTIWPLGFAVAAVIIALGLVVSAWLLVVGAIVFIVCSAGWIRDVARSRAHADRV